MRLIDADHLRETLLAEEDEFRASHSENGIIEDEFSDGVLSTMVSIYRFMIKEKTVDAVPAVHAHWNCIENVFSYEGTFDGYECSHCHKMFLDDMCQNSGSDYVDAKKDFKYCPFCGAKMDVKENKHAELK